MTLFWVDQATDGKPNPWLVMFRPKNGEPEITSEHSSRVQARAACKKAADEYYAIKEVGHRYQAQYAYACGYYD